MPLYCGTHEYSTDKSKTCHCNVTHEYSSDKSKTCHCTVAHEYSSDKNKTCHCTVAHMNIQLIKVKHATVLWHT